MLKYISIVLILLAGAALAQSTDFGIGIGIPEFRYSSSAGLVACGALAADQTLACNAALVNLVGS